MSPTEDGGVMMHERLVADRKVVCPNVPNAQTLSSPTLVARDQLSLMVAHASPMTNGYYITTQERPQVKSKSATNLGINGSNVSTDSYPRITADGMHEPDFDKICGPCNISEPQGEANHDNHDVETRFHNPHEVIVTDTSLPMASLGVRQGTVLDPRRSSGCS